MFFIILILSFFVFIRTIGYAIYEYKENDNTSASIVIAILAVASLVLPCVVVVF